jgi:hypothetical protein
MVIGVILVVCNLFEETRKISEATHPPSVEHLKPYRERWPKKEVLKNEK